MKQVRVYNLFIAMIFLLSGGCVNQSNDQQKTDKRTSHPKKESTETVDTDQKTEQTEKVSLQQPQEENLDFFELRYPIGAPSKIAEECTDNKGLPGAICNYPENFPPALRDCLNSGGGANCFKPYLKPCEIPKWLHDAITNGVPLPPGSGQFISALNNKIWKPLLDSFDDIGGGNCTEGLLCCRTESGACHADVSGIGSGCLVDQAQGLNSYWVGKTLVQEIGLGTGVFGKHTCDHYAECVAPQLPGGIPFNKWHDFGSDPDGDYAPNGGGPAGTGWDIPPDDDDLNACACGKDNVAGTCRLMKGGAIAQTSPLQTGDPECYQSCTAMRQSNSCTDNGVWPPVSESITSQIEDFQSGYLTRRSTLVSRLFEGSQAFVAGGLKSNAYQLDGRKLHNRDNLPTDAEWQEYVDYSNFVGCKARQDLEESILSQFFIANGPAGNDLIDASDADKQVWNMHTRVALRILAGIPNFKYRRDYVESYLWSQEAGDAYLAAVGDPNAVLRQQLGDIGFKIFSRSIPNYKLYAVPAPGEPAIDPQFQDAVGGCISADASELMVTTTAESDRVRLRIEKAFPTASTTVGLQATEIYWGDGTAIKGYINFDDGRALRTWHEYNSPGTYLVKVVYTNAEGVKTESSESVTIVGGTGVQEKRAWKKVRFDVTMGTRSFPQLAHGNMAAIDVMAKIYGMTYSLGQRELSLHPHDYIQGSFQGQPTYMHRSQFELDNTYFVGADSLLLKIDGSRVSGSANRHIIVHSIEFEMINSDGSTEWVGYTPKIEDVRIQLVEDGVYHGGFRHPTTKELVLPLDANEIQINLANNDHATNVVGCRGTFDEFGNLDATARFKSQAGGCQDTDTGLVWSKISETKMTWHDAMWDSSVPGSSQPDANDGDKVHDYDNIPSVLDNSPSSYCHDLVSQGFDDWRLPTRDELDAISLIPHTVFSFDWYMPFWSTRSYAGDYSSGYKQVPRTSSLYEPMLRSFTWPAKDTLQSTICVRDSVPGDETVQMPAANSQFLTQ